MGHRTTGRPSVAIERVFAQHNVQTVMGTAQAAGVAMLVAARRGIPVSLHTPSEVKASITGSGRASKDQVGAMVEPDPGARRRAEAGRRRRCARAGDLSCLAWRDDRPVDRGDGRRSRAVGPTTDGIRPGRPVRGATVIAQVSGNVIQVGPTSAVIDVGGIGILALCSPDTVAGLRVGQPATLATSLIVREDSLTLYGFASGDEREFFELLLTATGVGPKLAQAALAVLRPDELRRAIAEENLVQLCKVPGIGRKGAQRIVIELKDKINAVGLSEEPVHGSPAHRHRGAIRSLRACRISAGRPRTPRRPAATSSTWPGRIRA